MCRWIGGVRVFDGFWWIRWSRRVGHRGVSVGWWNFGGFGAIEGFDRSVKGRFSRHRVDLVESAEGAHPGVPVSWLGFDEFWLDFDDFGGF